ncbi:unnamed protein product [Caenorhabditis nigoni]
MTRIPIEKEFVIRHVFDNARWMGDDSGPTEMRYNIPWHIEAYQKRNWTDIYLFCELENEPPGWSIDADYEMKFVGKRSKSPGVKASFRFDAGQNFVWFMTYWDEYKRYVINKKLKVEFRVKINKIEGLENSGASEDQTVVLVVGKEKFKVDKKFLAGHSTYFNTLFFKSSEERGKSEIRIADCKKPADFQNFLKILKNEQEIDEKSINGVLELTAKFGSQSMLRKCEEFLIAKSKKSIKINFNLAIEYKLNKLKKKCLCDIKTKKDLAEIATENANKFNASVWKELLKKAITIN